MVGLGYRDAVRLLGGADSRVVRALDDLTGGLLLAASATGSGFVLSLFDARGELARLSSELVGGLGARLRGLGRFGRTERLAAAHAVIVVAAYFYTIGDMRLPIDARELELEGSEQVALAGGGPVGSSRLRSLAAALLQADVPMPGPQWPYEVMLDTLGGFYAHLSDELARFMSGLAVWDRLNEADRQRFADRLSRDVPGLAVTRYEELFRRLAVEFPEVGFWVNLADQQATRMQIRGLSRGLEGLQRILATIAAGRVPDERRMALSRAYLAALERPILTSDHAPDGLRLPALGAVYVNPDFRVAAVELSERIAEESWWAEEPVRNDLQGFLLGHLTAPQAAEAPLVILGQPGSGKSVLTQMLSARLPPSEFLAVRVELRDVPADADLQAQVEYAVRAATGESLTWPDLARSAGDALPVVLLDGFDELLQATGVSQTDYLLKVADFQRREIDQGRAVAVVVTSRTAVADRARPVPGMVAVRLEPFRDSQVNEWLEVWNGTNAAGFAARGLRPLPADRVLAHGELASQPLLLLMLALYDANGNALQGEGGTLERADLYERILSSFAGREVLKSARGMSDDQLHRAVEEELTGLAIAAFAMFNRSRQWVTQSELDADLSALLGNVGEDSASAGLRARLSAAQVMVGRFFFVHEAQATRDDRRLKTYEFLHATFGEYLLGRLVTRELEDLAESASLTASRSRRSAADDAFLHALLSFVPLTTRATAASFLADLLRALPEPRRDLLRTLVLDLFHDALQPRHDTRYGDYMPQRLPAPARPAAYTANLVLLTVLIAGEITGHELFPGASDPVVPWRNLALLWLSQLAPGGWDGLVEVLTLDRRWEGNHRQLYLRLRGTETPEPRRLDPYWTYNIGGDDKYRPRRSDDWYGWVHHDNDQMREEAWFLCTPIADILSHGLEPFAGALGTTVVTFHDYNGRNSPVSAANTLITLWLAAGQDTRTEQLAAAYDTCLHMAVDGFAPSDSETRARFRELVLRQLAADGQRLPEAWVRDTIREIWKAGNDDRKEGSALLRMAHEILPELMSRYPAEPE